MKKMEHMRLRFKETEQRIKNAHNEEATSWSSRCKQHKINIQDVNNLIWKSILQLVFSPAGDFPTAHLLFPMHFPTVLFCFLFTEGPAETLVAKAYRASIHAGGWWLVARPWSWSDEEPGSYAGHFSQIQKSRNMTKHLWTSEGLTMKLWGIKAGFISQCSACSKCFSFDVKKRKGHDKL